MKRLREEKLEIMDCPSSIAIEAFTQDLLRNSDLFTKLINTMLYTMEAAYGEARKFVNLERAET